MNNGKSKQWINPESAIKNMKTIVIGFAVIAGIAAFVAQILIAEESDLRNASTLAAEIIFGIFISLVVYVYSKRMHAENKKQQNEIAQLIRDIKAIEMKQQKLIEEAETFRKRKHDYVINAIHSAFAYFISTLNQNLEMIDELKNDNSEDNELIINNLFDNKFFLLDELKNLERILEAQSGAIDPSYEKIAKDICDELKQWQRNRDPYEYPDSSKVKTAKITAMMKELLEKIPNPPI
ncbi:MAG TPA: hypothetical protein VNL34_00800 [Candidatus Nitrosotenuis sp.]|jgi:uncharacterized membrane protein YtjA (UPF0391 family)|nr:hypothetical protein [Candidatus Nitrosotenuis sp.]